MFMTKLNYLSDTYLFESEAVVLEVIDCGDHQAVILDQTIFYPQGGGQPTDTGIIVNGNTTFTVSSVRLDEKGTVYHFGQFDGDEFSAGNSVQLVVDKDKRILNARLHSAGHLVDVAVSSLELNNLKPVKGYHFPDGPYVEYSGAIENPQDYASQIEEALIPLVEQDIKVEKADLTYEEARARSIYAPAGKSARVVNFAGYKECGCGGTHVNSSSEIGNIGIRKISSKKGKTRVCYELK